MRCVAAVNLTQKTIPNEYRIEALEDAYVNFYQPLLHFLYFITYMS